ncbi:hypothetical protein LARI1_G005073 [Lachnellula arida]|uniref:N-acetyltransferase domain-containing protein n=2 Tax=Lachnellula TaxID=47830 RepID=A0A8T9BEZ8_9HELO|nr:hypothetical protein LARI1_G005073 [Lachnellula arida]TVY90275.1 hypothetical protein LAWI1_G004736 [Lachnellula willkommii]
MPFKLEQANIDVDFKELIECEWESYERPLQTFFRLFCPIRGTGPHAREESLTECTQRQLEWHRSDPSSYWQKVTDSTTGKIVAGALWKICATNPFEHADHEEAYWFPKGGQRDFVNQALERFEAPRAVMGQAPQVYLNIIFTLPAYRRQGAADLIMDWGTKKAKEMGVEMWLDATIYGIPLYKKHGFVVVSENSLDPKSDKPNEEWKKIEEELTPMTMWPMWRPASGPYEEGKSVVPSVGESLK